MQENAQNVRERGVDERPVGHGRDAGSTRLRRLAGDGNELSDLEPRVKTFPAFRDSLITESYISARPFH